MQKIKPKTNTYENEKLGRKIRCFLEFNEYEILQNKGKVSAKVAKELANEEYNKFRVKQDREYKSDFDREIEKYLK